MHSAKKSYVSTQFMHYVFFDTIFNNIRLYEIVIIMFIYLSSTVMDNVSVKLYKYVCDEVVGSEKVVSCRRQFFNVHDAVFNHCDYTWHVISSGCKAEELNLPGSDYDVMYINKFIRVYELDDVLSNYHDLKTNPDLILDFENAVAGFTLHRIYDVREWNKELIHIYEDGSFLSNQTWKRVMNRNNEIINGPCFSDKFGMIDKAYCIKYTKWLSKARQWIGRSRVCGWSPEPLINNIVQ